ncbi:MAG TPA: glycerophosphodiester phosphodiesterase [Gemmatimonadaceae bacterium]|nr:glycerophosphodiester phosphodiesterase [Gemmatimonadaceae bacterium]
MTPRASDDPPRNPLLRLDARLVIGHRGAAGEAPENTLESFHLAVAQGADALELDVHLSADGVPVVIHDPDLRRTTDRAGAVAAHTVAELQRADAGHRFTPDRGRTFPWRGRGVRIPTLAEVVRALPETPLLIELKTAAVRHALRRVLEEHDAAHRCVPASALPAALDIFRETPFCCGASAPEIARLYFGTACGLPRPGARYALLSVPLRHRGLPVPTRWFLRAARASGTPVHVWTVDDPAVARALWARGAAGVVTNVPGVMVAERRAASDER